MRSRLRSGWRARDPWVFADELGPPTILVGALLVIVGLATTHAVVTAGAVLSVIGFAATIWAGSA